MRDYNYETETGQFIPFAKLETHVIQTLLVEGFIITDADGFLESEVSVRERLQLELEIRSLSI